MENRNEARRLARIKIFRIVAILAVIVTAFGVTRSVTGAPILLNLTDMEILGILVGLVAGALGAMWWMGRRT